MLNGGVTFIRFVPLLVNILNSYTEKTCISSSYLFGLYTLNLIYKVIALEQLLLGKDISDPIYPNPK